MNQGDYKKSEEINPWTDPRPYLKDPTWRSRAYQEFIRSKKCIFCGAPPKSEFHHLQGFAPGGIGTKVSDIYGVPACRPCHKLDQAYVQEMRVDLNVGWKIIEYLNEFLSRGGK